VKRTMFMVLAAALGLMPGAEAATVHPALAPFHAIRIDGVAHVVFTEAPDQSVTATGRTATLKRLRLTVENGVLVMRMKSGASSYGDDAVRLALTAPLLDHVTVSGMASGDLRGLTGPAFTLDVSGTARLTMSGAVQRAMLTVSGAGQVDAKRLVADDLTLKIDGTGVVRGYASKVVHVSVSGVGTAHVAGDPPVRDVSKSGIGLVEFN